MEWFYRYSARVTAVPDATSWQIGFQPLGNGAVCQDIATLIAHAVVASGQIDAQQALARFGFDVRTILVVDRTRWGTVRLPVVRFCHLNGQAPFLRRFAYVFQDFGMGFVYHFMVVVIGRGKQPVGLAD